MGAEREVEMERGRKDRRRWAEEKKKQTKHKEQRPKERRRGSRQRMSKRESELVATNPGAATSMTTACPTMSNNCSLYQHGPLNLTAVTSDPNHPQSFTTTGPPQ